jgi:hypothetical protein
VQARLKWQPDYLIHNNGFWIYDEALLARGKPLTVDKHFFYRDGKVFPVTGTTYMASDKHRRFLFEPNTFVWANDFRAMKEAGVNMVRTGIWTAWKKYMPQPGKVDEATLRAFDAFLLTAHKYDIPVIFTFFAFLPETWGGANAYLDPRSVKAQREFITSTTSSGISLTSRRSVRRNIFGAVGRITMYMKRPPGPSGSKIAIPPRPSNNSVRNCNWFGARRVMTSLSCHDFRISTAST